MRRIDCHWLAVAIVGILGVGAVMPAAADQAQHQRADRSNAYWHVGTSFTLVDHHGETFTHENLHGHWTLVLFGDTHCADACTAPLAALAAMYQRIARTEALKTTQVLFVSVDPERDTPDRLRQYLALHDERFLGATGPTAAVRGLAEALGAALPGDVQPVSSNHGRGRYNGSLFLIGPDSAVRAEFLPPFDPVWLTSAFMRTRARHLGATKW